MIENENIRTKFHHNQPTMNEQQRRACDLVFQGKNVLVTGGAGTGKTFFLRHLVRDLHQRHPSKSIGITSMTGSSALLIGGTTLHAYLGMGISKDTMSMMNRIRKFRKRKVWEETDVLIIDEVGMLSKEMFQSIDYIAKEFRRNPRPFGGIQIVLCGDFCQLACIDSDKYCFESDAWSKYIHETVYLTQVFRQHEDTEYARVLEKVRFGEIDDEVRRVLGARVRPFPQCDANGIEPTKLYPYRKDVSSINTKHLRTLIDEQGERVYEFRVQATHKKDSIKKMLGDQAHLTLCKDAQVILTVNLDIENGLVNGSRGVVIGFEMGMPIVRFVHGVVRTIEYYTYHMEEDGKQVSTYMQVPLVLGWAITIHKSQGMTLDYVVTDLFNIFDYGQGYVTLSRVRRASDIFIAKIDFSKLQCDPKVVAFYRQQQQPM